MRPNRKQGSGRIPPAKPRRPHAKPPKTRPQAPRQSYLNNPGAVTAPRTLRDIYRDAGTATDLRYGGQQQQLDALSRNTPVWFEQHKAQLQGINQGVQQGYQQAIADINARTAATQQANDQSRQQNYAQMQTDAASRGATVDPSVFANDANAATVRRQGADAFANLLTGQGTAQNAYFGGLQGATGTAQIAQQALNAQNNAQLQADKGNYRAQYVTDAAQTEHRNRLEDQAFGLNEYKAQTTAALGAARIKSTAQNQKAQRKATSRNERNTVITSGPFAGLTNAQVRQLSPQDRQGYIKTFDKNKGKGKGKGAKPAAGPGSLSPDSENAVVTKVSSLFGLLSHPPRWPGGPRKGQVMTAAEVINHYGSSGTDPRIIALAQSLYGNNGSLDADGVKAAHALGIHVGGRWKVVRRKKQYTPGSDTPVA